jgi:hypothetical protein
MGNKGERKKDGEEGCNATHAHTLRWRTEENENAGQIGGMACEKEKYKE